MMQLVDLFIRPTDEFTPPQARAAAEMAAAELRAGAPLNQLMEKYDLMDSGKLDEEETFDFAAKIRLGNETFDVASKLNSGEVSEPFVIAGGDVHVVYMIIRRPAVARDYDEARDTVLTDFKRAASRDVEMKNIDYLKARAEIAVAPEFQQ
jgi:hypothetical protein